MLDVNERSRVPASKNFEFGIAVIACLKKGVCHRRELIGSSRKAVKKQTDPLRQLGLKEKLGAAGLV